MATKLDSFQFKTDEHKTFVVKIEKPDRTIVYKNGIHVETIYRNAEQTENRITQRDLSRSEIPPKRDSKRHNDRVKWRGEEQTKNEVKAIYDDSGHTFTKDETWEGTRNVGPLDVKREHTNVQRYCSSQAIDIERNADADIRKHECEHCKNEQGHEGEIRWSRREQD